MDISNYIESGILEEFVLGSLSEKEAETVFALAEKYPEIMAEIDALEDAMGDFAMARAVTPSEDLFGKVMNRINEMPELPASGKDSPKRSGSSGSWLYAASVIGLIGSLCLNIYFSYWLEDTQQALVHVEQKAAQDKKDCEDKNTELQNYFKEERLIASIAKNPAYKRITVTQTADGEKELNPGNNAIVFWNSENFDVKVMSANLNPLPKGSVYKLWTIQEGQALPFDQGVFEHSPIALQDASRVAEANAFAVSIEPEGQICDGPCGPVVLVGAV